MKSIFCGNFEYNARQSEIERLFSKYGRVDKVDMKQGFAFVYMDDERDAEDAIHGLDRREFGMQSRRRLRVEWTKERGGRREASSRRSSTNIRPSKTLFVINFDPINARTRDLERHFEPYGKVLNARIKKNFAFIQFESQEDATKALEATNMSKLLDQVISVEYAVRDDDDYHRRVQDYSPDRRGRNHGRSRSPYGAGRQRASPDYGPGASPFDRPDQSLIYNKYRSRSPTKHNDKEEEPGRLPTKHNDKEEEPGKLLDQVISVKYAVRDDDDDHRRVQDYSPDRRGHNRGRSRSPYGAGRQRASPDYGPGASLFERPDQSPIHNKYRSRSPTNHNDKEEEPGKGMELQSGYSSFGW